MLVLAFTSTLHAARTGADWAWSVIYRELAPPVLGYLRAQRRPGADPGPWTLIFTSSPVTTLSGC